VTGRIAILSAGLWRLKGEVAAMTGLSPVRAFGHFAAPGIEAVAGWGHKPTAAAARRLAAKRGIPYLAVEDGFLRSVRPGPAEPPASLVLDRAGIYYDAGEPSDLEGLIAATEGDEAAAAKGLDAIDLLRRLRLSKYNAAPLDGEAPAPAGRRERVLVVDQTFADASIIGGLADEGAFAQMVEAALAENPGVEVLVRLHPEVVSGAKRGYLQEVARRQALRVLDRPLDPWRLLEGIGRVYTVSSQLGLEALMAGCRVTCFGVPFYAGWGLTDDRRAVARRGRKVTLGGLVAAAYLRYCRYFDAWTREPVDFATAAEQLAFLRDRFHANARPVVGWRIPLWKRPAVSAMLEGAGGPVRYVRRTGEAVALARAGGGTVAAWGRRAEEIRAQAAASGIGVTTIEDGFLRSVGLGAGFTPALSYVFDRRGIYYDPVGPSDIEALLAESEFDEALIARARRIIALIREGGITKYNLKPRQPPPTPPAGRPAVLVPGQVADDESVRRGAADLFGARPLKDGGANLELLIRVRARVPDAFIIYRPHPDVEAGFREGRLRDGAERGLADAIDRGSRLDALIARVDRVETATSLLGFEALVRGKPVTVHGAPFYAGWGLTEDLAPTRRRGRKRTLEELVAAALIAYPVYLDPVSGRVCPVEQAVRRLAQEESAATRPVAWLRHHAGAALGRLRHVASRAQAPFNRRG
jgi:capsular polysaccharide export protein